MPRGKRKQYGFLVFADEQRNTYKNFLNLATDNDVASLKVTHFHYMLPALVSQAANWEMNTFLYSM